jgi:hypothetical protein
VKTLHSIALLETDATHVQLVIDIDESERLVYEKAMETVEALKKVSVLCASIPLSPLSCHRSPATPFLAHDYYSWLA